MDKSYNIQICKDNKAILKNNGYMLNGKFISFIRNTKESCRPKP